MAGNAFTNLNTISLSDNFRAWFDKTNEIVGALNPVSVYGVTPGSGITVAIDANGIATVGVSLGSVVPGNIGFTGSITFSNEVRFTGLTLDVSGATLFGDVVRSVNGKTGAVTIALTGMNDPTTATGDIVIKTGGTFAAYSLFNGDFDAAKGNMPLRFAASGGMLLGGSTSGTAGVHAFTNSHAGSIQLALDGIRGSTTASLHLKNIGYTGADVAESGTQIFFGRIGGNDTDPVGLVVRPGGSNEAFDTAGPMIVLDQTNRSVGVNGVTAATTGVLHIKTESSGATSVNDITLINSAGDTAAFRTAIAGSTGEYTSLEGGVGTTTPRFSGFVGVDRLRTIINSTMPSTGVELRHSSSPTTFTIQGQESSGASLSPVLVAKQNGQIIIGGITQDMGGSTFGSLNLVSGSLLFGGTNGSTLAENGGVISVLSKGGTVSYKNLFSNSPDGGASTSVVSNISFSGVITDDMVLDLRKEVGTDDNLQAVDENASSIASANNNADAVFLEFIEYDASGNKRYAVGNFEIDITMPSYIFVNDLTAKASDEYISVIGAVALVDSDKTLDVPTGFSFTTSGSTDPLVAAPSAGYGLVEMTNLFSPNPQQMSFRLRGNCSTGVRVALIVSKTHNKFGKRNGAIYRAPGSFSASFFNVE